LDNVNFVLSVVCAVL